MENILYNDLIRRGFDVDVGVVEYNTRDEDDKKYANSLKWILSSTAEISDTIFSQRLRLTTRTNADKKPNP